MKIRGLLIALLIAAPLAWLIDQKTPLLEQRSLETDSTVSVDDDKAASNQSIDALMRQLQEIADYVALPNAVPASEYSDSASSDVEGRTDASEARSSQSRDLRVSADQAESDGKSIPDANAPGPTEHAANSEPDSSGNTDQANTADHAESAEDKTVLAAGGSTSQVSASETTVVPHGPLNLTLPDMDDMEWKAGQIGAGSDPALLPDMFVKRPEAPAAMDMSGKLHWDESEEAETKSLRETITGAEVELKFRLP